MYTTCGPPCNYDRISLDFDILIVLISKTCHSAVLYEINEIIKSTKFVRLIHMTLIHLVDVHCASHTTEYPVLSAGQR